MGVNRTVELLEQFIDSKKNLANMLVEKGEEANANEPFDTLVEKAGDYVPKTYFFCDGEGNEFLGTLVDEETVFTATANDIREGIIAASDLGVVKGEKVIPSYHTSEGYQIIMPNSTFIISVLKSLDRYDFTKLQAIICPWTGTLAGSVKAEKVSIDGKVYKANSNVAIAEVIKDSEKQQINFQVTNESNQLYVLRYFTYKEIY